MPSPLLDRAAVVGYLGEVAGALSPTRQPVTIIVGGALLAWHGLRQATLDVHCVTRIDAELGAAIAQVAARHRLAPKWLNDSAAAFLPATFVCADCELLLDDPSLIVLGLPWDLVFLMKLNPSRAVDTSDMRAIWPRCTFESPDDAAAAFYEAYPLEAFDRI